MEKLREGFTTGTAASAAAKAAVMALFGAAEIRRTAVPLPPVQPERGPAIRYDAPRLEIEIEKAGLDSGAGGEAEAAVIKRAGDDPDVTDGIRVIARVSARPFDGAADQDLNGPMVIKGFSNPVFLYAGHGVGRVTLPGLPVAVGEPAINPASRLQIAAAACEAAANHGYAGPLHIRVSVPEGEKTAEKTLNPRLGIKGGISILGTSGIVRPFSHEAWKETISQGIRVAKAAGADCLLLSTGRGSEKALWPLYPDLPEPACVQAADLVGFALRLAAKTGFESLVLGCFAGKLLKLAQGLEWTHARSGLADLSIPLRLYVDLGGNSRKAEELSAIPTAAGVLAGIREESGRLHMAVLTKLAGMALGNMRGWIAQEFAAGRISGKAPVLFLRIFDPQGNLILTEAGE